MRFLGNVILEIFSEYTEHQGRWKGETKMQEAQVSKQELHYLSPAYMQYCSAVQCSTLCTAFGLSVSLSLSIETEKNADCAQ